MTPKFPYRYRVLVLLFFLMFITYLDRITISLVGVRIKSAFQLSNEQFGWVVGAFALAYAIFEIPSGMLGDRWGQKKVLIRIVLWWSFFTALTGATTGLYTLLLTRFLFGMGEAGAYPNGSAVICRWFPRLETSRGLSVLIVGQNAGAAIAPLIVVPLALHWGWRVPFFFNGLIGLVWVAICLSWFRNEPAAMKGISKEEVKLVEENRRFDSHHFKFPWKILKTRASLWLMFLGFFCSQWALYFYVAWMSVYLQQGRHFSESAMKTITMLTFGMGMVGALAIGWTGDYLVRKRGLVFGRRFLGTLALGVSSICFTISALAVSNTVTAISLMIGEFFTAGMGIIAFSVCVDIGGRYTGTVAGMMNFAGQTGAFFLSISFGKIVDHFHNFNTPLLLISGVLLLGSICWQFIQPNRKLEDEFSHDGAHESIRQIHHN